jgi:hypothetical protein
MLRMQSMLRLALLLALALAALRCGGGGGENGGEGNDGYPTDVVENFMGACEPSAVQEANGALTAEEARSMCRCIVDELQETLPLDEFVEYDARADEPGTTPPPEATAAVETCTGTGGSSER